MNHWQKKSDVKHFGQPLCVQELAFLLPRAYVERVSHILKQGFSLIVYFAVFIL
jgi:hypothetical protein